MKTSGIGNRELVELCAPCHSRRTELGDYDHRRPELLDNLLPTLLDEGLYHPDGQILDEDFEYGSFVQSKMFRMGVRCTDCHDAHSAKLRKEGNGVCLQCHAAPGLRRRAPPLPQAGVAGEALRRRALRLLPHAEVAVHGRPLRADHSIRIPRPDLTQAIGVPNACASSGCHDDKSLGLDRRRLRQVVRHGEKAPLRHGVRRRAGGAMPPRKPDLLRIAADALAPTVVRATALALLGALRRRRRRPPPSAAPCSTTSR